MIMADKKIENPCPIDGAETEHNAECPTYKRYDGTWMRCSSPCGNASSYSCTNPDCDWMYLEDVSWDNPNYARYLPTNGPKPEWLA